MGHTLPDNPEAAAAIALASAHAMVTEHADRFADSFYRAFLDHAEASAFLNHGVVQQRLTQSLREWLAGICSATPADEDFAERQRQIGDVHARLKIPIHLVLEGASLLKAEMATILRERGGDPGTILPTILVFGDRIDLAMRHMSAAFVQKAGQRARADEAYRLFALGQDVSAERESQRAALMEWSHTVLFDIIANGSGLNTKPLAQSPFGLWVRHRANVLFEGTIPLENMRVAMRDIDEIILPGLAAAPTNSADGNSLMMNALRRRIDEIKFLLNDLFQTANAIENGHDPLTRTLNRRFLASIVSRELGLAKENSVPFSLLMLDVDHFKAVNDTYGHASGDAVLQQVADVVLNAVRPADFVFRYGGEEFLVALVETGADRARDTAEAIRAACARHRFRLPGQDEIAVTLSIGVAEFDGHPDYKFLIDAADQALYAAKAGGRNCVRIAGSGT